jgi:hypothetical protein
MQAKLFSPNAKKLVAVIFVIFLFLFIKYKPYEYSSYMPTSSYQQIFSLYFFISNQTLGMIHEAGHGICYILPCPEFFMVLNGTLFQVFLPLGIGIYYKRRQQIFPWLIALFFTGFSLQYTAWYISTAHISATVSAANSFLGVDGYHDFNYILSHLHILKYNSQISFMVKIFSYLLMILVVIKMVFIAFVFDNNKKVKRVKRA